MNRIKYLAVAFAALAVFGTSAKSPKRGVSENGFSLASQLEALEPGVTWYYNWGNTPNSGYQNQVIEYEGIEYVPMCWNANYNADKIREYCKSHPQTKYLLGFNEPNFTAQANMTPQQAAEAWPAVKALADELGLKLVAPALNYSPNPPYTDPLKWMDEFVALVGLDAFDYTAVHNYGGLGVMQTIAGNFHNRYGKDVWVTEFCYWPGENNGSSVSPETQIESMVNTLEWLETTPWIYRYAWFKATGNYNASTGPNYGLVRQEGGAMEWGLTPQGKVYTYMGTFDTDSWLATGTLHPAVDYVSATALCLGETADPACTKQIEINRFNAGATATWQFDVPKAGAYTVTLNVSGFGEPTRFDSQLQWVLINGDSETALTSTLKPALPNSDTAYNPFTAVVELPAGHVKLRLKDMAPYQPSGIRISTIRLDDAAGVDDVEVDAEALCAPVYNLQGIRVADSASELPSLPKGVYITGGQKILR